MPTMWALAREHVANIVARPLLRIAFPIFRYVRGWIAARVEGDAAIAAREIAHLRLVTAIIAGEFVHEHDRVADAGLFVVEADAVISNNVGHRDSWIGLRELSYGPARCARKRA
jgi:hypothetical protein